MTRSCTLFSTSVWPRRQLWSNWPKPERYRFVYVVQMYSHYSDSVLNEFPGGLLYQNKWSWYEAIRTFLTTDVVCEGVGWFPRRWVQGIGEFATQVVYWLRSLSPFMSILCSGAHQLLLWILVSPWYGPHSKACQGYVFRIGGGNDKQVLPFETCFSLETRFYAL